MDLSAFRTSYDLAELSDQLMSSEPLGLFDLWFKIAIEQGVAEPNAMVLSTVGNNSKPFSRIVLLKEYADRGFTFFTNYQSQKSEQIDINPNVSLLFFWSTLQKQVRIEGKAYKVSREESIQYFDSRPEGSKAGAIASPQSKPIAGRQFLEESMQKLLDANRPLTCPEQWGGFFVKPEYYEFWQGRENRLHDRLVFSLEDSCWKGSRLAP